MLVYYTFVTNILFLFLIVPYHLNNQPTPSSRVAGRRRQTVEAARGPAVGAERAPRGGPARHQRAAERQESHAGGERRHLAPAGGGGEPNQPADEAEADAFEAARGGEGEPGGGEPHPHEAAVGEPQHGRRPRPAARADGGGTGGPRRPAAPAHQGRRSFRHTDSVRWQHWNALPNNIKTSACLATFKARPKTHFFLTVLAA